MPKAAPKVKPAKAVDFGAGEIWFERVYNNCIKCLARLDGGEYAVNKDMAYCPECAALLHLGESKESRMFRDFQDNPEIEAPQAPDYSGVPVEEESPTEA